MQPLGRGALRFCTVLHPFTQSHFPTEALLASSNEATGPKNQVHGDAALPHCAAVLSPTLPEIRGDSLVELVGTDTVSPHVENACK